MSTRTVLTGSGAYVPPQSVTNEQLCATYNEWARAENERHAEAIAAGTVKPLLDSSPEFVEKVSGIRVRHLVDASGVLDPTRMCPNIPDRADDDLSVQAELARHAALAALESAGRHGEEIDLVIVGSSSLQRPYPAIAIELQRDLGARGFAYDVSVGCASATFAIQLASEALRGGSARRALVVAPELPSAYANFRNRDSHFILGDAAAAVVVERKEDARAGWEILATTSFSSFTSAVRNNGGFLNRCDPDGRDAPDKLFYQDGPRVFRDIVKLVPRFIDDQLATLGLSASDVSRFWLHQANGRMNDAIASRLVGSDATPDRVPSVLAELGNTASAGALVAFDGANQDLPAGSVGVLCAFGAGYTIGSQILRRL